MADSVALSAPSSSPESIGGPDGGSGVGSSSKEFRPLYGHFNLPENARNDKAFGVIWDYAKSIAPSKDKDSVLFEVIRLGHRLGSVGVGTNPYQKMEMYAKIWKQGREAEHKLTELEAKEV